MEGNDAQVAARGRKGAVRREDGETWDGRDQIIVFQVAVSFLEAGAEGFQDFLNVRLSSFFMLCG